MARDTFSSPRCGAMSYKALRGNRYVERQGAAEIANTLVLDVSVGRNRLEVLHRKLRCAARLDHATDIVRIGLTGTHHVDLAKRHVVSRRVGRLHVVTFVVG